MNVIFIILIIAVIVASVFLTLVILLQNSKGGGLASNFTAGNQTFGVRQTTDILEKITWGLVAFVFVVSIISSFIKPNSNNTEIDITNQIENTTETAPDFPVAPVTPSDPAAEVPATEVPAE